MKQKKLLLLGGSEAQIIAIRRAKEMGIFTVVCDYLPDNPGQYIADKFFLASTTDKDAILEIAKNEQIDGIVAYSSDPAAPTAAFVAGKLGLPGIDYDVVCHLCEKQLFRKFLQEHGFNVPKSIKVELPYKMSDIDMRGLSMPVIVKPTDSSGSKGITVIRSLDELEGALKYAQQYSRNKTLIIEEFIERDHPHVIEAELFVIDGEVKSWGLINSIRDWDSNPLLPAGYTYPLDLPADRVAIVKSEIKRLIASMEKPSGAFNIEMIIDKRDKLFFLDAGPRNGGNMLPEFISMISEKDIIEATILNALGERSKLDVDLDGNRGGYWGLVVLHSDRDGIFSGITYNSDARASIVRKNIQKKIGDKIKEFSICSNLIGLSFHKFETSEKMKATMYNMSESFQIELK